jgi:hypothetical protein
MMTLVGEVLSCAAMVSPPTPLPTFSEALSRNIAEHAMEFADSKKLGFVQAAVVPSAAVPTEAFGIDRRALGMGDACPFDSDELIHATVVPLFSDAECRAVRAEASKKIAAGAQSTFTMTDTNRDVPVHELPNTLAWFNREGMARVASLAHQCFPSAVDDPTALWVYRGLVRTWSNARTHSHLTSTTRARVPPGVTCLSWSCASHTCLR